MIKYKKAILLALLPFAANSSPFVRSDATLQTVTHCGYLLDSAAKVDFPVATEAEGKYCNFDVSSLTVGTHTIRATFVNIDPIWGRSESVNSAPFTITRPGVPAAPVGLGLIK